MTLVTSVNDVKQAGSLEPLTWLGDPGAVVATVNVR